MRCACVFGLGLICLLGLSTLVKAASPAVAPPGDPSYGSGGAIGSVTREVHVAGLGTGTQTYYLYVPTNYAPTRSWPLLLVLHGVGPYPDTYATMLRDDWSSVAEAGGFIVAAPTAHEQVDVGGIPGVTWLVPPTAGPTDYDGFAAIRADIEAAYNIERTRIYGWGFSAGGHVMHDLAIHTYSTAFNAMTMAAYGVAGGDLFGLTCASDAECAAALAALPRKIPVDIHIGTDDPNYPCPYALCDRTRFLAQGWIEGQTLFFTTFSGGHTYTVGELAEVWANLRGFTLTAAKPRAHGARSPHLLTSAMPTWTSHQSSRKTEIR